MSNRTVIHVGIDDTDSPSGMCTTFLAYKIVGMLKRRATTDLLDLPRLIRFNPNIPWKTRGNGAVSLKISTVDPLGTKARIRDMVVRYSDTQHGANPGLVFLEGDAVPAEFASLSRLALWQLVGRKSARGLLEKNGIAGRRCDHGDGRRDDDDDGENDYGNNSLEFHYQGNGQGLVGAIGAIGYDLSGDHTLELLTYRRRHRFGSRRDISAASVRDMQARTFPNTFGSMDADKGRVLIAPHGPDPVFYGVRGEDIGSLVEATSILQSDEKPEGYMIFRSNQATGDHLRNELTPQTMRPYASGWAAGTVCDAPRTGRGGHVFFSIGQSSEVSASTTLSPPPPSVSTPQPSPAPHSRPGMETAGRFWCAVYKPTGIATVASRLMPGDSIRVGGGVRKASKNFPRMINAEFIDVLSLASNLVLPNPMCRRCEKRMKSKGVGQGFECIRCGLKSPTKTPEEVPRQGIRKRLYIPRPSAHRHLTRPAQRMGITNKPADTKFDASWPWFCVYGNDDSGE